VRSYPSCTPPAKLPLALNQLVALLPDTDRAVLTAACSRAAIKAGQTLGGGAALTYLPEQAVLSLVNSHGVEIGLVGREGMSGWSLLDNPAEGMRIKAACSGEVLVLPTQTLTELCRGSSAIRNMVLRSVEMLAAQMMATIGVSARHSIRARLTRRLLMLHDRSSGDEFEVKHVQLAEALGVRRASVTDALHLLEGERVLRCRRNLVCILDRSALEGVAGNAYGPGDRIPDQVAQRSGVEVHHLGTAALRF
jgi:CRP-like cAMP-binding protein